MVDSQAYYYTVAADKSRDLKLFDLPSVNLIGSLWFNQQIAAIAFHYEIRFIVLAVLVFNTKLSRRGFHPFEHAIIVFQYKEQDF